MVTTERRTGGARWTCTLFIVFTVAFAAFLAPNSSAVNVAGSAAANAALPTFSTPCFTPAAIYNGLPPQQTSSYTVPATGVSTVRAVLRGQNGGSPASTHGSTAGGLGATLIVEVAVTPGQVLHVGKLKGAPGGEGNGTVSLNGEPHTSYAGGNGGDAHYLSTAGSDGCQHALAVAGAGGGGAVDNLGNARGGNADTGTGASRG